jgi:hypothetical protein
MSVNFAPAAARSCAIAFPIPLEPPVKMTCRPEK